MTTLTGTLIAALDARQPMLAAVLARETVDRHRGAGRFTPGLRYALAPVDALAARFAAAIAARPGVRAFHPYNTADVRQSIGKAKSWKAPRPIAGPFAVPLADATGYRTLVLDLDAKTCDPVATGREIEALFHRAGVRYVTSVSGPEGSRHVLATWQERVPHSAMWRVVRALAERFPALDTTLMRNAAEGCVRPPLSRHYSWGRSRPIGDVYEALRILEAGNPAEAWRSLAAVLGVPLLSRRMEDLLYRGDVQGRYPSRSEAVQAIAVAHAAAGSTEQDLIADLVDENNAAGERVREERSPRAYVRRSRGKAVRRVGNTAQADSRHQGDLAAVRDAILAVRWTGQAGHTDRVVLLAHLEVAERVGRSVYHLSCRDVAVAAGIALRTVPTSEARLRKAGWLRRSGRRTAGMATRWHLRVPEGRTGTPHSLTSCENVCGKLVPPRHDIWRRPRGLGKGAMLVYEVLMGGDSHTVKTLAVATGYTARSVRRYLLRLARYRLAVSVDGRWSRGPASPDEVAIEIGVAGTGERQQRTVDRDREAFRQWLGRVSVIDRPTGEILEPAPHRPPRSARPSRESRAHAASASPKGDIGHPHWSATPLAKADLPDAVARLGPEAESLLVEAKRQQYPAISLGPGRTLLGGPAAWRKFAARTTDPTDLTAAAEALRSREMR